MRFHVLDRAVQFYRDHQKYPFISAPEDFRGAYEMYVRIGQWIVTGKA